MYVTVVMLYFISFRFSINWSRLLPKGFANHVSDDGVRYYSDLIDELLSKGIKPVITLYHWEMPPSLQKFGKALVF